MPYVNKDNYTCGFLDFEDRENSGHFVRRYFMIKKDHSNNCLEYYLDNPSNLLENEGCSGSFGLEYISLVGDAGRNRPKVPFCFYMIVSGHRFYLKASDPEDRDGWIDALREATRIVVTPDAKNLPDDFHSVSYTTRIVNGKIVRTVAQSEKKDTESESSEGDRVIPQPPHLTREPIKAGYCVKQGAIRKNWKRRYFVLDDDGLTYYKSAEDLAPLKLLTRGELVEARDSVGIHVNRSNVFEVVTATRVYYIQATSPSEQQEWIVHINALIGLRRTRSLKVDALKRKIITREPVENPQIQDDSGGFEPKPYDPVGVRTASSIWI